MAFSSADHNDQRQIYVGIQVRGELFQLGLDNGRCIVWRVGLSFWSTGDSSVDICVRLDCPCATIVDFTSDDFSKTLQGIDKVLSLAAGKNRVPKH